MKKVLLFLAVFCTMFGAVKAQTTPVDCSFAASDIQYWVGEGSNQVVFSVVWADRALAWGYRFSEDSVTVMDVLDSIVSVDSRLSYVAGWGVSDILYVEGNDTSRLTPHDPYDYSVYFNLTVNHVASELGVSLKKVANGDFVKFGDTYVAEITDSAWIEDPYYPYWDYTYVWPQTIFPALLPDEDASFSPNLVQYWISEGWNEVVFSVVWAGKSLAWGYRFTEDTTTVQDVMAAIAANDTHFSYVMAGTYLSDIFYVDGTDTARLTTDYPVGGPRYPYFSLMVNNMSSWFGATHPLVHGDFVKWGDSYIALALDSTYDEEYFYWDYTFVWPQNILPAPAPEEVGPSDEVFDGPVGTEGCQAIRYNDPAILGWASTCTINRGRQDIVNPIDTAGFGTAANAIGAIDTINSMSVVSLGDCGSAVLTFDIPIQNGEGYDFAVFENGFNASFLELAFVEVSSDGIHYFRFPAISNTPTDVQVGPYGSLDCTKLKNLAGKYQAGWGTPFDLEDLPDDTLLDKNNITHVKLVDVVGTINPRYATRDSRGHIINDPYPNTADQGGSKSGFDLDGVCVLNGWRPSAVREYVENNHLNVYPNPCNTQITVEANIGEPVMVFNTVGKLVYRTIADDNSMILNVSSYPAGLYIVKCGSRTARIVKM